MKFTLTISSRGVVTLPAKLRKRLGMREDGQISADAVPEGLLLRPPVTLPIEMYTDARVQEFEESESELEQAMNRG